MNHKTGAHAMPCRVPVSVGVAIGLSILVAACRPAGPSTQSPVERAIAAHREASRAAAKRPSDAQARADRAHLEWLYLSGARQETAKAAADREARRNPTRDDAISALDRLSAVGHPTAIVSRMWIARGQDDPRTVRDLGYAFLRSEDAVRDAELALLVAQLVVEQHGELIDDDTRFGELYDALETKPLDARTRQVVTSHKAQIERRHDRPYASYYAAQGCVQSWSVSELLGHRGALELETAARLPFTPLGAEKAGSVLIKVACAVRVRTPEPRHGMRWFRSVITTGSSPVVLDLETSTFARFYVDGTLVHQTDTLDRQPVNAMWLELLLPLGEHLLEVALAPHPDAATWFMVRATDRQGRALSSMPAGAEQLALANRRPPPAIRRLGAAAWARRPHPSRGARWWYGPWHDLVGLHLARLDGDAETAAASANALARVEQSPEVALALAEFAESDVLQASSVRQAAAAGHADRAIALDPRTDRARIARIRQVLQHREPADALDLVLAAPVGALDSVQGRLSRFRVLDALGRSPEADKELAAAARGVPSHCEVLHAQFDVARDRGEEARAQQLATALASCPGTLSARANFALDRGDLDLAISLQRRHLERTPDDLGALRQLARLLAAKANVPESRAQLDRLSAYAPRDAEAYLARADLSLAAGGASEARQELSRGVGAQPSDPELWRAVPWVGPNDLEMARIDGLGVWAEHRERSKLRPPAEGEAVSARMVLDRSVVILDESGASRRIVHMIVQLFDKAAIDHYGEVEIPHDAELLTLRTIKADGTTVDPERVDGKSSLSLRHLEVGDLVEYEVLNYAATNPILPGRIDLGVFRFQSFDTPLDRSEYVVIAPASVILATEARGAAPKMTIATDAQGRIVRTWRALEMPRRGVEPHVRAALDEVPGVHVYAPHRSSDWFDAAATQFRLTQRTSPELRRKAADLVRGVTGARERFRRIWRFVVEEVTQDESTAEVSAGQIFSARRGDRLVILHAMLREVGIRSEYWLLRNNFAAMPIPGGHPGLEAHSHDVLAVDLGEDAPLLAQPGIEAISPGLLGPAFRGGRALRLHVRPEDAPAGFVDVPDERPEHLESRHLELDLSLDARGSGIAKGSWSLRGTEAVAWRQVLRRIDGDRIEEVFQSAELGPMFPSATLTQLSISGQDPLDDTLELRFEAKVERMGASSEDRLRLQAGIVPFRHAAPYTTLPLRKTGLIVSRSSNTTATIRVTLRGATLASVPLARSIRGPYGAYERSVTKGRRGDATLEVRVHSTLRAGVLPSEAYPPFLAFGRAVDEAEGEAFEVAPRAVPTTR